VQPAVSGIQLPPVPKNDTDESNPGFDTALLVFGGHVRAEIRGGTVANNTASTPLLVCENAHVSLTQRVVVHGNQASAGGAVKAADSSRLAVAGASVLRENVAEYGGAVHASGNAEVMMSGGARVVLNKATMSGGAVLAEGQSRLWVSDSFVHDNTAATGKKSSGSGGCIFLGGSANCRVVNSTVSNCTVASDQQNYGGAFFAKENASLSLVHAVVEGNAAQKEGAGIALADKARCNIVSSRIAHNTCRTQGCALYAQQESAVHVKGRSAFVGNRVEYGNGGAVMITKFANLTVEGPVVFADNVAAHGTGAAINMYNQDEHFMSSGCRLKLSGGVLFTRNSAMNGAAIVATAQCQVDAVDVQFVSNRAVKSATVAVAQRSRARFTSCQWFNNTALDGSAVAVANDANVTLRSCLLQGQTAKHCGATFFATDNASLVVINSTVKDSNSFNGGAVYAESSGRVTLINTSVVNCSSQVSGGAVYLMDASILSMTQGSRCEGNVATSSGGCAIVANNASLIVSPDSRISRNRARYGGGVAFIACDRLVNPDAYLPPVVANNTATLSDKDVYIDLKNVSIQIMNVSLSDHSVNSSVRFAAAQLGDAFVLPYVSRSAGMDLQLVVRAWSEVNGRPAAGIRLSSLLLLGHVSQDQEQEAQQLAMSVTNDAGLATFASLDIKKPPGPYTIRFEYINLDGQAFRGQLRLAVRRCQRGEVSNGQQDVCDVCPPGRFSLAKDPSQATHCVPCSDDMSCAEMPGGAVVLPAQGFWMRAANSSVLDR
jgi:hypothetical protein